MKTLWHNSGNRYSLQEVSNQIQNLPKAIYVVRFDPRMGFFLEQVGHNFPLPSKIYGLANTFCKRVVRTWGKHTR